MGGKMTKKSQIRLLSVFFLGVLGTLVISGKGWAGVDSSDMITQYDQPRMEIGQCMLQAPHGGGEVPSLQVNQHVELAVGEYYSLYGTVIAASENPNATSADSVPMFAIDLKQHPWLASATRLRSPYYYLPGGWTVWGRYLNKRVLLTAQAQAVFVRQPNGERVFGISLQPVDGGAITPTSPAIRPVN